MGLAQSPAQAAITYFASGSNPADNGTLDLTVVTVAPPPGMQTGDLVILVANAREAGQALAISVTGGQTWTAQTANTTRTSQRIFWARYNGAWAANPSVSFPAGANATTVAMHVFRPSTMAYTWALDVAQVNANYAAPAAPRNVTIAGIATLTNGALVFATWASTDNNTWALQTAGWANAGGTQYRNLDGSDGSQSAAYKIMPVAGASGNVTNRQTVNGGDAGNTSILAFREIPIPVTTLGTGSDPAAATVAPGSGQTIIDQFTLQTDSGTEAISDVTVNLSTNSGVGRLSIYDGSGAELGFTTSPVAGSNTITVSGMSATTTLATFTVRVTPLSHAAMPAPPGAQYPIVAPVTAWSGPNSHAGSDTDVNALTIDNQSPNGATATSGSAADLQVTLNWTTSSSADFSRSVVLRWTGGAAGAEVPAEGVDYVNGSTIGAATVACVRTADAASTAVSGIDGAGSGGCGATPLASSQAYTYKVFQKDVNGNYDAGVALGSFTTPAAATPLADYHFDECAAYTGAGNEVLDNAGGYPAAAMNALTQATSGGAINGYGGFTTYDKYALVSGTGIALGASWSVSAWIKWEGAGGGVPWTSGGVQYHILASFNTGGDVLYVDDAGGNVWGVWDGASAVNGTWSIASLSNGWHHLAAVASGGSTRLYVDGVLVDTIALQASSGGKSLRYLGTSRDDVNTVNAQGWRTPIDEMMVFNSALTAPRVATLYNNQLAGNNYDGSARAATCGLDHLQIEHGSGSGVTCTPSTLTLRACADAACLTPYTGGVTGTLTATGGGTPTVNWSGGAGFSITAGSSTITKDVQVTTAGNTVLGTSGVAPAPLSATACDFGAPSCTFTSVLAGFLVSAPHHVSCTGQTLTVQAVKQSDSSLACTPAFSSTSKTVTLSFAYDNPAGGTRAPVVGGTTISTGGTSKSLSFDASGIATPSFVYDDVGRIGITVDYAGSGGTEGGLSMTGTTSPNPIIAPASFAFSAIAAAPLTAGADFSATVTALNACGSPAATPNFGQEASAEGATLSFTRTSPTGAGVSNGSFSGSLGGFAAGAATGSNLNWSEVGEGTLTATLASGSYLGSGLTASGTSGTVGRFKPAYFDTAVTDGCSGATPFTYSGQPFTATVTAKNQAGGTTVNYDGSLSPSFANATTLTDASGGTGTWGISSLVAADFVAGVASKSTQSYTFASVPTAPAAIVLRATETAGDGVTSSGHTEGTTTIHSGRARLFNANGSELLALPLTLRLEHWAGTATGWTIHSADTCTAIAASDFAFDAFGGNLAACETALTLGGAAPNYSLSLSAPGAGDNGWADLRLNLSAAATGNQCTTVGGVGPAATTANVPWLRYNWKGAGVADPTSRATFGVIKSGPVIYRRERY